MTDTVFPQPESALDSPFPKAEIARDMEALLEAIHTKDSALLEKENVILEKENAILGITARKVQNRTLRVATPCRIDLPAT